MYINFTPSFCDKYATLTLMAELTPQQIKKLKADKAVKITTQEVVCK